MYVLHSLFLKNIKQVINKDDCLGNELYCINKFSKL